MRLTPFNISIFSIFILPPLGGLVYSVIELNKISAMEEAREEEINNRNRIVQ